MPTPTVTPLKGQQNGLCNRTACQKPGAAWYNHATRAYYCQECAELINSGNRNDALRLYDHEVCTPWSPGPVSVKREGDIRALNAAYQEHQRAGCRPNPPQLATTYANELLAQLDHERAMLRSELQTLFFNGQNEGIDYDDILQVAARLRCDILKAK